MGTVTTVNSNHRCEQYRGICHSIPDLCMGYNTQQSRRAGQ